MLSALQDNICWFKIKIMKNSMNLFEKLPGLLFVVLVAIMGGSFYIRSEMIAIVGLLWLFNLKEGKQDERAKWILYSSAYFALAPGFLLVTFLPLLNSLGVISFKEISANVLLIVVLASANVLRFTRQYVFMA